MTTWPSDEENYHKRADDHIRKTSGLESDIMQNPQVEPHEIAKAMEYLQKNLQALQETINRLEGRFDAVVRSPQAEDHDKSIATPHHTALGNAIYANVDHVSSMLRQLNAYIDRCEL